MIPEIRNLYLDLPRDAGDEIFDDLLSTDLFRLERIISTGQTTPAGEWLEQAEDEWVMLVRGGARLEFEGESEEMILQPGDSLLIPAQCRHRVSWTIPGQPTVWLALHTPAGGSTSGYTSPEDVTD